MPVILRSFNQQNLGRLGNVEAGFKLGKHVFKPKTRTVDVEHTLGDEKNPSFGAPEVRVVWVMTESAASFNPWILWENGELPSGNLWQKAIDNGHSYFSH